MIPFEGDAFFPIIDEKKWKIENREDVNDKDVDFSYSFITYVKKYWCPKKRHHHKNSSK